MKVAAYCPLHYGSDYLKYAIESVKDDVEHFFILYTPTPSHGSGSGSRGCPDSEEDLYRIVTSVLGFDQFTWIKGAWTQENQQRNYAHEIAKQKGYDILVALDFDEIWRPGYLADLVKLTYERKATKCLVWMRHLWRSFNYICDDSMRQERIYYLGNDKTDLIYAPQPENQIFHFGYARRPVDMEYKIGIHGHSSEWLQTKTAWFNDKFMAWPPVNENGESNQYVHPVCSGVWAPQKFDKELLPEIMKDHPYYNLEVI